MSEFNFTEDSWKYYVECLNDDYGYDAGIEVFGDTPDTLSAEVDSDVYGGYPPTITFTTELDSDGETDYITFIPIVEFPALDGSESSYADHISYILDIYADKLGKWVKSIMTNPYSIDRYTADDEGYYN